MIPRRRLGRSGLEVTGLGLGGVAIGGGYESGISDAGAVETVHHALSNGVNYVDTSPLYRESERRIGLALRGVPRESYVLSTKTGTHPEHRGDYSWDGTMWSVANSLRLLGCGHIDLLYVHDPVDLDPVFAARGALEALEWLKEQGVIRAIGLGQRRHDFHARAIESGRFDVILTYNDYHQVRTTAVRLLPLAAGHDVGVVNGSPLAHGLLNGQDPDLADEARRGRLEERDLQAARRFYRWCLDRDLPMVPLVLQFCLRQPLIHSTLTGARSAAELEYNLRGARMAFSEETWLELEALRLTEGQS